MTGATDDREVIRRAVAGCDGVLVDLVPRGVHGYSTGTAPAVLDHAQRGARLVFSCGWHITRDGRDVYSWKLKALVRVGGGLARLVRFADLDDQVEACRRIFASDTRWTVVRGSDLEDDESQGLPVWSRHVGDPILASNITRRVDFALFMVDALHNDELIREAPAIVSRQSPSALAQRSDLITCRGCDGLGTTAATRTRPLVTRSAAAGEVAATASRRSMLKTFREGQLVTVASGGVALDGVVAHVASLVKVEVAVEEAATGLVFRTVHPKALMSREEPGSADDALRRFIQRGVAAGHQASGGASGRGRRAHTRAAAHRPPGR